MKKFLISLLCILMISSVAIFAEGDATDVNVKIEKTAEGYLVTIPNDESYKTLKPTMTVFDSTIESAYAAKLDANGKELSYIDVAVKDGRLSFVVSSGGVYKLIPCSKTESGLIYDLGVENGLGNVENTEAIAASLEKYLGGSNDVKTNLDVEQEEVLKNAVNSGKTVVFTETMKVEEAEQTNKVDVYLKDNSSLKAVLTVDINIFIDYKIDGSTAGTFGIKELNEPVTVSVKAPDEIKKMVDEGKKLEFEVLCVHESADPVSIPARYENGYIYFDARLFSSFTVAYKEKVSVSNESPESTLKPVVNTSCR